MRKLFVAVTVLLTFVLSSLTGVQAHDEGVPYAVGGNGKFAKDGRGHCIRTIRWKKELAIPECEGEEKMAEEPAPEPEPEPVTEAAPAPAPEPAPEPEVLQSVALEAGALFASNSATVTAAGVAELTKFANNLGQFSQITSIQVDGHADSRGSDAYNLRLSERRAEAVKDRLVNLGVDESVISTHGYGEAKPVADNSTAAGRAQNRRVELEVVGLR